MSRRFLFGGIIAVLLLGGCVFLFMHHHTDKPAAPPKPTQQTDTIKPNVQITTPSSDLQNVQGTLTISVNASDNRSVTHVTYSIDGTFAGISYASPFGISLDVSNLTPGKHTLTAIAYDNAGNASQVASIDFIVVASSANSSDANSAATAGSSSKSSSGTSSKTTGSTSGNNGSSSGGGSTPTPPDTTPPTAPTNVTASDPGTFFVHLTWTASTDNIGVAGYQIWRDGGLVTTVTGTTFDDHLSIPGGSYQYKVVAYDAAGNTTAASPVSINLGAATIFNAADTTPASDSGDTNSIEVGTRFRATKNGSITGVRFYKAVANTGTHIGNLWTNAGVNLATVTFTNESATGWQTATFSTPVHITAGTTYMISYFAPNSHYSGSSHYFNVPHATNSYLTGLQDGTDGTNGSFSYSGTSTFPTSTFGAANYWVDATFTPDTPASFISFASCAAAPSFPDANCTGAPGGDNISPLSGGAVFDNDNQVYSNLKVDGNIIVRGCNDTLRNVEVDSGEVFTDNTTPDLFAIWLQVPANCTTTIDHVSVITKNAPNNYVTTGIRVANGGPVSVTNTRVTGVQIGILTGPGTFQDNYLTLGTTMRGDHNEVILEDGTTGLTLNHNTMLNPNNQTAAIALFTENSSNSNILVENNLLAGGGYTVYAGDGKTDGGGNPIGPPSNISFINNVFWRKYYPDAGSFASGRDYNPLGGGQWTNNLYMNADGTLTSEQVPQPPVAP